MCRPGWGEYSASCLMSWTPTWAKVILQLTAPCWQKAWLEAWFPPAQLYWDRLDKSIALPCKPSACHWLRVGIQLPAGPHQHQVWGSQVPSGAASSCLQDLCCVSRSPLTALGGGHSFTERGLPLCPGLVAAWVDDTFLLAPPAERQFPHWHLTPRGQVS